MDDRHGKRLSLFHNGGTLEGRVQGFGQSSHRFSGKWEPLSFANLDSSSQTTGLIFQPGHVADGTRRKVNICTGQEYRTKLAYSHYFDNFYVYSYNILLIIRLGRGPDASIGRRPYVRLRHGQADETKATHRHHQSVAQLP